MQFSIMISALFLMLICFCCAGCAVFTDYSVSVPIKSDSYKVLPNKNVKVSIAGVDVCIRPLNDLVVGDGDDVLFMKFANVFEQPYYRNIHYIGIEKPQAFYVDIL